jgi:hypothetical protein
LELLLIVRVVEKVLDILAHSGCNETGAVSGKTMLVALDNFFSQAFSAEPYHKNFNFFWKTVAIMSKITVLLIVRVVEKVLDILAHSGCNETGAVSGKTMLVLAWVFLFSSIQRRAIP